MNKKPETPESQQDESTYSGSDDEFKPMGDLMKLLCLKTLWTSALAAMNGIGDLIPIPSLSSETAAVAKCAAEVSAMAGALIERDTTGHMPDWAAFGIGTPIGFNGTTEELTLLHIYVSPVIKIMMAPQDDELRSRVLKSVLLSAMLAYHDPEMTLKWVTREVSEAIRPAMKAREERRAQRPN